MGGGIALCSSWNQSDLKSLMCYQEMRFQAHQAEILHSGCEWYPCGPGRPQHFYPPLFPHSHPEARHGPVGPRGGCYPLGEKHILLLKENQLQAAWYSTPSSTTHGWGTGTSHFHRCLCPLKCSLCAFWCFQFLLRIWSWKAECSFSSFVCL